MGSMHLEKEWEIRRLASKKIYEILSDTGNIDDARQVSALVFTILMSPVEMPAVQKTAELVKLYVVSG